MDKIKIERPSQKKLNERGVFSWPIWEKGISRFEWYYDSNEICYLLEGKVVVETKDGKSVEFGKGNLVTFSRGLSCIWNIKESVRKHYAFE
ncbi:MAG: cupin domain-containing protein [Candidatus Omnitrophica bacterium]|nr:cupin domain-containing protein [Candidatus Omnitrophota bacterium]